MYKFIELTPSLAEKVLTNVTLNVIKEFEVKGVGGGVMCFSKTTFSIVRMLIVKKDSFACYTLLSYITLYVIICKCIFFFFFFFFFRHVTAEVLFYMTCKIMDMVA